MIPKKSSFVNHHLKSHPAPFSAVWSGEKLHEIRFNDRGFKMADVVRLLEWNPDKTGAGMEPFTGRAIDLIITYIRFAPPEPARDLFGLLPGFCVFDFLILNYFKDGKPIQYPGAVVPAMTRPPFSTMANPE